MKTAWKTLHTDPVVASQSKQDAGVSVPRHQVEGVLR